MNLKNIVMFVMFPFISYANLGLLTVEAVCSLAELWPLSGIRPEVSYYYKKKKKKKKILSPLCEINKNPSCTAEKQAADVFLRAGPGLDFNCQPWIALIRNVSRYRTLWYNMDLFIFYFVCFYNQ